VPKPRKRWPGELDKPIRVLPAPLLTNGGRITSVNADDFNRRANEALDAAVHAERWRKRPLIAAHYGVGAQNYAGIAKALAQEFVRGFDGDLNGLRESYAAADNKALAVTLSVKYCSGFAYKPTVLAPERATPVNESLRVASGAVHTKLAEGRPQIWSADRLHELLDAVEKAKKSGKDDRQALNHLRRRPPWREYGLEHLESRLQDAKRAKKQKN
jgi:hypothetical protein